MMNFKINIKKPTKKDVEDALKLVGTGLSVLAYLYWTVKTEMNESHTGGSGKVTYRVYSGKNGVRANGMNTYEGAIEAITEGFQFGSHKSEAISLLRSDASAGYYASVRAIAKSGDFDSTKIDMLKNLK